MWTNQNAFFFLIWPVWCKTRVCCWTTSKKWPVGEHQLLGLCRSDVFFMIFVLQHARWRSPSFGNDAQVNIEQHDLVKIYEPYIQSLGETPDFCWSFLACRVGFMFLKMWETTNKWLNSHDLIWRKSTLKCLSWILLVHSTVVSLLSFSFRIPCGWCIPFKSSDRVWGVGFAGF